MLKWENLSNNTIK